MQGDGWREWLGEIASNVEYGSGNDNFANIGPEEGRKLVNGFHLLAEAVEVHQRHIDPLWCPICDEYLPDGRHDKTCEIGAAERFLRGVVGE